MATATSRHYDLGQLDTGNTIRVTLSGNAANVRLLDDQNYRLYRRGQRYRYHGLLARTSPVNLAVPRAARWYIVVDLEGLGGRVRSAVEVIS